MVLRRTPLTLIAAFTGQLQGYEGITAQVGHHRNYATT